MHEIGIKAPKFIRKAGRVVKKAGRVVKKVAKVAVFPPLAIYKAIGKAGQAIIRKIFGKGLQTTAQRRARYLAYQRRGSRQPNQAENKEAMDWAQKYAKSQGFFGKMMLAVRQKAPRSVARGYVGAEPVSVATIIALVPLLTAMVKAFVARASKQGAPVNPMQATPEQNLQPEIAQGYREQGEFQAAEAAEQLYQPPSEGEAEMEAPAEEPSTEEFAPSEE